MIPLLVWMSVNAACELQVRCHQIKIITVKRSKLRINFYKIVIDLQEFVVIKVFFKAISEIFISKHLFPVKYDMINTCKVLYNRYKMKGTKHPWVHEQELKALDKLRCTIYIETLINPWRFFLGGCTSLLVVFCK